MESLVVVLQKLATDLVMSTARSYKVDIIIASEPNKAIINNSQRWLKDRVGDTAIYFTNGRLYNGKWGEQEGITWADTTHGRIISCYCSPNCNRETFENWLNELQRVIEETKGQCIAGGDFNSKSPEWGSSHEDRRGQILRKWAASNRLLVLNIGNEPTFTRGQQTSVLDVTFATEATARRCNPWRVLNEETGSDHNYIYFKISPTTKESNTPQPLNRRRRWAVNKLNRPPAIELLKDAERKEEGNPDTELSTTLLEICNNTMPKPWHNNKRKQVYWWNEDIAQQRKRCLVWRRKMTRAHNNADTVEEYEATRVEYKTAKRELKALIRSAKKNKWTEICDAVEEDPCGIGYKIVAKALGCLKPPKLENGEASQVADVLFPTRARAIWRKIAVDHIPLITREEVIEAGKEIRTRRAPGPDGIPPEIIKLATEHAPNMVARTLNKHMVNCAFPVEWKVADLLLLRKPGKQSREATAYRPLCLLNTTAKLYERVLCKRLTNEIIEHGDLSDRQYGFRKGRSTVAAAEQVVRKAKAEMTKTLRTRKLCAITMVDIKNAFNSAPWQHIVEAMVNKGMAGYLINIIQDYLTDRTLIIEGNQSKQLSCGVPQGSVLGPLLWNVLYDGALRIDLPEGATLTAYADDLAIQVIAWDTQEVQRITQHALALITEWLEERGMELAPEKTVLVNLSGRKKHTPITIEVGDQSITEVKTAKYLGLTLDNNLSFGQHLKLAVAKAEKTVTALGRLMPRFGGPGENKRRLLGLAAESVVLYGAKVWLPAVKHKKYMAMINSLQRKMAVRITRAYRTAPTDVLLVLARTVPMHLRAKEIHDGWGRSKTHKQTLRSASMTSWQREWQEKRAGTWAHRMLGNISDWHNRKHGEVTHAITQVVTGHGAFGKYLKRFGKTETEACWMCENEHDDAEHTVYECPAFAYERECANTKLDQTLTPDNMIQTMLQDENSWNVISGMLNSIMERKVKEELRIRPRNT